MKMLAVYTDNFQPLFNNFKKSLGDCSDIELVECPITFSKNYKEFKFQSDSWYEALEIKIFNVIRFIKNEIEEGQHFIISDVDVHFFQPNKIIELVRYDKDIIGIKEKECINGGFIIAKHNPKILDMYEYVYEQIKLKKVGLGDQDIINEYLIENKINWGCVDGPSFQAQRILIGDKDGLPQVKKSTVVFHATCTKTLEEKMSLINEVAEAYEKL